MQTQFGFLCSLLFFTLTANSFTGVAAATDRLNPFTPKASLVRYWNNKIYKVPRPSFLLSKASPLSLADAATFVRLAANNSLSTHLDTFCSKAHLFCFPDPTPNLSKHSTDVSFSNYADRNFTNYGTDRPGGADSFEKYSPDENLPVDTFRRYSRDSTGHDDQFSSYASEGNVVSQTFNTYGTGSTGGSGEFKNYAHQVNVPGLMFTSYSANGNGRAQKFTTYADDANSGDEGFASYGRNGNGLKNAFTGYGDNANVVGSGFSSYNQGGNGGADNFTSYGGNQNVPQNNFKNYGATGNALSETFTNYRDQANVGDDSFQSYGKQSNSEEVKFSNYGQSFNDGSDRFKGYGVGAEGQSVDFKTYGVNNTFKSYAKDGVSFADYKNTSSTTNTMGTEQKSATGKRPSSNKWIEPGKFFREDNLKTGTVMPMPDIKDKMPVRSFLPRTIASKIPFSSSRMSEMKAIFHAFENSSMETILNSAVKECERAPSVGEKKRCVGSAEDMIDFAVSVLGNSVELRTTENVAGSKKQILIGKVTGINGGKVTESVSCHQSLYPYLLYYCHAVPKVRVYEAELLDPDSKKKINHGVAICHLDTSAWSPTHGAFLALGPGPGKIEVCHWIFENDMTWTVAD